MEAETAGLDSGQCSTDDFFAGVAKPRPVIKGFEKELTDTSKQAVRGIRK